MYGIILNTNVDFEMETIPSVLVLCQHYSQAAVLLGPVPGCSAGLRATLPRQNPGLAPLLPV